MAENVNNEKEWISVLLGGDLHKRPVDISTIEGYVECNYAVQQSLIDLIKEMLIDYFISLGDWYDKGYASDVSASLVDYDLDLEMRRILKGNFYGLIGNHVRLNMDSNPELHLIQPHPYLTSRRKTRRKEQILKTPEILRIRDVQISFQHYSMAKEKVIQYKPTREPWAKYHIALFHTPLIVPNAQLSQTAYGYNVSSNGSIAETLENVDLAIVGDIHKPIGRFIVNGATRSTVMIIPGSLTNTDAGEANRHTAISMPLIKISKDSEVQLKFVLFDLKTNLLTFKPKTNNINKEKIKTLRGNAVDELYEATDVVSALGNYEETIMSLNAFLNSKGYTTKDKKLIKSVLSNPSDLEALIGIYSEEVM